MTIHKCKDCAEYDKVDHYCQFLCEPKNDGNTCKEWVDDKERIENTREINEARGFYEDISLENYRLKYL